MQMLKDRGYIIGDEFLNMDPKGFAAFLEQLKEQKGSKGFDVLNQLYQSKMSNPEDDLNLGGESSFQDKIAVYWVLEEEKVNQKMIKMAENKSKEINVNKAIMIVKEQTSLARKELSDTSISLEMFQIDDLQVNITHHVLVPKHSVLNEDQKHELLVKYRIKEH